MDETVDIKSSLLAPSSRALLDYWLKIRGSEIVPIRANLRPGDIAPLLPSLMILGYRDPDELVFRLVGTEIVNRLGVDFTSMNLSGVTLPRQFVDTCNRFKALRTRPCGLVMHKELQSKYGTAFVAE